MPLSVKNATKRSPVVTLIPLPILSYGFLYSEEKAMRTSLETCPLMNQQQLESMSDALLSG